MIPRAAHNFLLTLPPKYAKHYEAYCNWRWGEKDLRRLRKFCKKRCASLDIGANNGSYTYFISMFSARCYAFEPNKILSDLIISKNIPNTKVINKAVSDTNGVATLRFPTYQGKADFGRASIERSNVFLAKESVEVRTCVLDDLDIQDVGFIKIDVEGHEYSVLKGAIHMIETYKPNLMIELDDRYNPGIFDRCNKFLSEIGYEGFFYFGEERINVNEFEKNVHQNDMNWGTSKYISNCFFKNIVD